MSEKEIERVGASAPETGVLPSAPVPVREGVQILQRLGELIAQVREAARTRTNLLLKEYCITERMLPDGIEVNIKLPGIIDEKELYKALDRGEIKYTVITKPVAVLLTGRKITVNSAETNMFIYDFYLDSLSTRQIILLALLEKEFQLLSLLQLKLVETRDNIQEAIQKIQHLVQTIEGVLNPS